MKKGQGPADEEQNAQWVASRSLMNVGSLDESGYLNSFYRQGYNLSKCLSESFANAKDAGADKIVFEDTESYNRIIDNGRGMSRDDFKSMFSFQKPNHSDRKSCGISGIGGKIAQCILSNKKTSTTYTFNGDEYLVANAPWDRMFEYGVFSDMITIDNMNQYQIDMFNARTNGNTGTIIEFPRNDDVIDVIKQNFSRNNKDDKQSKMECVYNPCDMINVVFGGFRLDISYKRRDGEVEQMQMYDYFGEESEKYYDGKTTRTIEHYYDARKDISRYILKADDVQDESDMEIPRVGRGYSKDPRKVSAPYEGYIKKGEYVAVVGQRHYTDMDEEPPETIIQCYDDRKKCFYDEQFEEGISDHRAPLYRNGQMIGKFHCSDVKYTNSRANSKSYHEIKSVQLKLSYSTHCTQDNLLDKCMGIQQNKNQFQSEDMPVNLTRLLGYIKKDKATMIYKYFESIRTQPISPSQPSEVEQPVSPSQPVELRQSVEDSMTQRSVNGYVTGPLTPIQVTIALGINIGDLTLETLTRLGKDRHIIAMFNAVNK